MSLKKEGEKSKSLSLLSSRSMKSSSLSASEAFLRRSVTIKSIYIRSSRCTGYEDTFHEMDQLEVSDNRDRRKIHEQDAAESGYSSMGVSINCLI